MSKEYKLTHPVEVGGRKLEKVTLRRPTGKDVRAVGNVRNLEDIDFLAKTAANLAGLTLEEMDALDVADVVHLVGVVGDFFGGVPPSGKEESTS